MFSVPLIGLGKVIPAVRWDKTIHQISVWSGGVYSLKLIKIIKS